MATPTGNLVTTTPTRFSVIRPELLPTMQVLHEIDTDAIIDARLAKFKEIWMKYDPPNAAQYDVERTEFDPIVIHEELAAFFEALVRDRVNQACRAITLVYASGSDLDAIASRYPYGLPRLPNESDPAYRQRIWLSPNILSLGGPGQGVFESYIFWAMSAPMPAGSVPLKHATAMTVRGTGNVYITLMSTSPFSNTWTTSLDGDVFTLTPGSNPVPSKDQISAVYQYVTQDGFARKGLTDVINVTGPKITNVTVDVYVWLFPGVDRDLLMGEVKDALVALVKAIMWLGGDMTDLALKGALAQAGVYRVQVNSPTGDILVGLNGAVNVTSIRVSYKGTGE